MKTGSCGWRGKFWREITGDCDEWGALWRETTDNCSGIPTYFSGDKKIEILKGGRVYIDHI